MVSILIGVLSGIMLAWLILIAAIWLTRPDDLGVGDMIRLLPDLLRLFKRVATDRAVPRMVRVELVLLLCYLVSPMQLIPDFIPVIGFLDDAVLVAIMLRIVGAYRGPADAAETLAWHTGRTAGVVSGLWSGPIRLKGAHA